MVVRVINDNCNCYSSPCYRLPLSSVHNQLPGSSQ